MPKNFPRKPLNIGVYISNPLNAGGANTAERTYLEQIIDSTAVEDKISIISDMNVQSIALDIKIRNQIVIESKFLKNVWAMIINSNIFKQIEIYFGFCLYSNLERVLIKERIDLIFCLGINPKISQLKRIPYVTFIWDVGHLELNGFLEMSDNNMGIYKDKMYRDHIFKARNIFCESDTGKKNIEYYYRKQRNQIYVTPFTVVNSSVSKPKHPTKNKEEAYVLYPAHFWSHKNHLVLFYALRNISERTNQIRKLFLTGEDRGTLYGLIELAKELQIEKYIEFLGFVDKEKLEKLYADSDLVVMPSLLGPTNFPPLEALENGKPVFVSTTHKYLPEICSMMKSIDPYDVEGWSKLFDLSYQPEIPDTKFFQLTMSHIAAKNIDVFKEILSTLSIETQFKRLYKEKEK